MVLDTVQNHDLVVEFTEPSCLSCELPTPIVIKYAIFTQP